MTIDVIDITKVDLTFNRFLVQKIGNEYPNELEFRRNDASYQPNQVWSFETVSIRFISFPPWLRRLAAKIGIYLPQSLSIKDKDNRELVASFAIATEIDAKERVIHGSVLSEVWRPVIEDWLSEYDQATGEDSRKLEITLVSTTVIRRKRKAKSVGTDDTTSDDVSDFTELEARLKA